MKVNLGTSKNKKSFFPISLDSSSSANFGEVIPLFCHEIVPDSHVKISISDAVRFAPLSFPTFGRAYLKTYSFAHQISDLFPPFDDMLARTPYTSSNGTSYIPQSVPTVPLWFLWLSVLSNCEFTIYSTNLTNVSSLSYDDNFVTNKIPFFPLTTQLQISENDESISNESISASFPYWLFKSLISDNGLNMGTINDANTTFLDNFFRLTFFKGLSNNPVFVDLNGSNIGSIYVPSNDSYLGPRQRVLPSSADFIFPLTTSIDYYLKYSSSGNTLTPVNNISLNSEDSAHPHYIMCIRLNDSGKFLRKILLGLGYQLTPCSSEVSLLPLYAYFKSYFETFAPQRFVKFQQTSFYRLINHIIQNGSSFLTSISSTVSLNFAWFDIIDELLSCFYTKDTDYYSSQIIGLINNYGSRIGQEYLGVRNSDSNSSSLETVSSGKGSSSASVPSLNLSGTLAHTQSQQNILSRLTSFVNRRSVVGGKIASLLKSVFGISDLPEYDSKGSYLGSTSLNVDFSDVFSTAETAEGSLGEYAGKAMAFSNSQDTFSYDSKSHTLVLSFCVVVPRTQYVQGVNPLLYHCRPSDFYNPMFDGLTLLPTRVSSLYSPSLLYPLSELNGSFGNQSIFAEYKTKTQGILNGDLSLASTKGTYDSFTMDEVFGSYFNQILDDDGSGGFETIDFNFYSVVAGTMWRYLGRWLWLGRFDRIFVNNRISFSDFYFSQLPSNLTNELLSTRNTYRSDDNLILHHVVDLNINAPMIPLSGSYLTDDMLSLNPNGITVTSE